MSIGKLPGTRFVVDEFREDRNRHTETGKIYFLSHFHSDHYTGISSKWAAGPIYCTPITANLLLEQLDVNPKWVRVLCLNVEHDIDGHQITCLDANHCPGAAVFIIRTKNGLGLMHTGDFRATKSLAQHPAVVANPIDTIYLDTTYCHPKHELPPQESCVQFIAAEVERILKGPTKTLVLIATYTIGKEKILLEIAQKCDTKIAVEAQKLRIFKKLEIVSSPEKLDDIFTTDKSLSDVHVIRWSECGESAPGGWTFHVDFPALHRLMSEAGQKYQRVALFVPTGWTYGFSKGANTDFQKSGLRSPLEDNSDELAESKHKKEVVHTVQHSGKATAWMVPYSEHSSYSELRSFVGSIHPRRVVPTVVPPSVSRRKILATFRDLVDDAANRRSFIFKIAGHSRKTEATSNTCQEIALIMEDLVTCPCCKQMVPGEPSKLNLHIDQCLAPRDVTSTEVIEISSANSTTCAAADRNVSLLPQDSGIQQRSTHGTKANVSDSSMENTSLQQLISILPDSVTRGDATVLLEEAGGDVSIAVSQFFDNEAHTFSRNLEQAPQKSLSIPSPRKRKQQSISSFFGKIDSTTEERATDRLAKRSRHFVEDMNSNTKNLNVAKAANKDKDCSDSVHSPFKSKNSLQDTSLTYNHLATTFSEICKTKGRLEIISALRKMFASILESTRGDIGAQINAMRAAVYLCTNGIAPQHKGIELGIGGSLVSQAVSEVTGRSKDYLRSIYKELGDLGDVAFHTKSNVRSIAPTKPLKATEVFEYLLLLSKMKGNGSSNRKRSLIIKLLVRAKGEEIRFLVRTLLQNLRTGAVGKILQTAVAHAYCDYFLITEKSKIDIAGEELKTCFSVHPQWDTLIDALTRGGFARMKEKCRATAGVPITPMLAKVAGDLPELVEHLRSKSFQADYKYDGVRAQIHLDKNGQVHIFSRHLENVTDRYPDVQEAIRAAVSAQTSGFIVDAEIVGFDRDKNQILEFQQLQSRPRKAVSLSSITVQVKVFLFDMMAVDDTSLLQLALADRLQVLRARFQPLAGRIDFVDHRVFHPEEDGSHDLAALRTYLQSAFTNSCEGLMIKELGQVKMTGYPQQMPSQLLLGNSTYEPSSRCKNWLKVKRDYLVDSVADTIDVVPIGAWYGNGRKAGWYSPFLVAVWDPQSETFQALCKVMSGFSDAFYKEQLEYYSKRLLDKRSPHVLVGDSIRPSIWFKPSQVWELKFAEFTVSPTYEAGVGLIPSKPGHGLSCRFPRFVRIRDDKPVEAATTAQQIVELYNVAQKTKRRQPSYGEENSDIDE